MNLSTAPSDVDLFDPAYIADPYGIWDELRTSCPIARLSRWGGAWLPTRHEDVVAIAPDVDQYSSRSVQIVPPLDDQAAVLPAGLPPVTADPPVHTWSRRLLLPSFSPQRVEQIEPFTRSQCRGLVAAIAANGEVDAAADYAHRLPAIVIAHVLGVPTELSSTFAGWVRDALSSDDDGRRLAGRDAIIAYATAQITDRRASPKDDLITELLNAEVDGQPLPDAYVLGTVAVLIVAGVDTTASAISSALWHLATHPEDRRRLVELPSLLPAAIEEFLRAYSPVTMARIATTDVELSGCPIKAGDRVVLNLPAANRDPAAFADAGRVVIDRANNRHVAFGIGIHRCVGSHLARMELRVALSEWLAAFPSFRLCDPDAVTWTGGQVRGPRNLAMALR